MADYDKKWCFLRGNLPKWFKIQFTRYSRSSFSCLKMIWTLASSTFTLLYPQKSANSLIEKTKLLKTLPATQAHIGNLKLWNHVPPFRRISSHLTRSPKVCRFKLMSFEVSRVGQKHDLHGSLLETKDNWSCLAKRSWIKKFQLDRFASKKHRHVGLTCQSKNHVQVNM